MRDTVRCGLLDGRIQFRQLLMKSKTVVLLIGLLTLILSYMAPLADAARAHGETVNVFEPFLLLLNTGDSFPSPFFYVYLFFAIIFSDMPIVSDNFRYRVVRVSRGAWWLGQLMCVTAFTVFYILFLFLATTAPFIGMLSFSDDWSKIIQTLAYTDMTSTYGIDLILKISIINVYGVYEALWQSALLTFIYLFASAVFICFIHLCCMRLKPVGVAILIFIYMFDYIIIYNFSFNWQKYSFVAISRLISINNGYSISAPTLTFALSVWAGVIVFLIVASRFAIGRAYIDGIAGKE